MVINEYLIHFIGNLNNDYFEALKGLSNEQLYFLPNDNCNHIAFHAWHFLRTEDNVINFVCQNRKSPVWIRQELPEKWGFPKTAQGTAMEHAEANALRLPSVDALIQYGRDVWTDVEPYLANASEDELLSKAFVRSVGDQAKLLHIMQTIETHGNRHLGQIFLLKSFQGLKGEAG